MKLSKIKIKNIYLPMTPKNPVAERRMKQETPRITTVRRQVKGTEETAQKEREEENKMPGFRGGIPTNSRL
jgi:hypothetical protein